MGKRDTHRYIIKTGNTIQKFGITDQLPEERASQNKANRVPGKLEVIGPAVTRDSALEWERSKIENYKKRNGRLPPYNEI